MSETSTLISCTGKITRAELAQILTPPSTPTHVPIPHAAVVEALVDTLSHRQISVVEEEYAVSKDGMEMFGVLDLATGFEECRFAIGIRNANNKRFRLACTVGLRVFVCMNLAFRGDFSPVLAKHSKGLSLEDTLSIGVDRMQRNFEPMRQQVESWRAQQMSTAAQTDDLPGIHRRGSKCSPAPGTESARSLLQHTASGIPAQDHVEPLECVHQHSRS
jgi:hypothetical protein